MKSRNVRTIIAAMITVWAAGSLLAQGAFWGIPNRAERAESEKAVDAINAATKSTKRVDAPAALRVGTRAKHVSKPDTLERASRSVRDRRLGKKSSTAHYIVFFKAEFFPYQTLLADGKTQEPVTRDGRTLTEAAEALVHAAQGELVHVYQIAAGGFSALLTESAAADLASMPEIALVELDQERPVSVYQWGADRLNQKTLPLDTAAYGTTSGLGVHVYVMDSGIRGDHQEFTGRLGVSWSLPGVDPHTDYAVANGNPTGHGTHVAGIIGGNSTGVAPAVTLHSIRVSDNSGVIYNSTIVSACSNFASVRQNPAVVNMSFGGLADPFAGASYGAVDNAVLALINSGVTVVVAAGNAGALARDYSPAHVVEAITVGASDSSDVAAGFSNYGSLIDVWAPGVSVQSAWYSSSSGYDTKSGTSMAAPQVTGLAALYLQTHPNALPDEVRGAIVANATKGAITGLTTWGAFANQTSRSLAYVSQKWIQTDQIMVDGTGVLQSTNTSINGNIGDVVRLNSSSVTVHADPGQFVRVQWVDENDDLVYGELAGPGNMKVELDAYAGAVAPAKYFITDPHGKGRAQITIEGATGSTYFSVYSAGSITESNSGLFRHSASTYNGIADLGAVRIEESPRIARVLAGNAIFSGSSGAVGILAPFTNITQRLVLRDLKGTGGVPIIVCATPSGPSTLSIDGGRILIAGGDLVQGNNWRIAFAEPGPWNGILSNMNPGYSGLFSNGNADSWGRTVAAQSLSSAKLTWSAQYVNAPLPPGYSQPTLPFFWYPSTTQAGTTAP